MLKRLLLATTLTISSLLPQNVEATETDQYLTWGIELKDSENVLNNFLNKDILPQFLEKVNSKNNPPQTDEELGVDFYKYVVKGLLNSRIRKFINNSDEVEKFPNGISKREYRTMSIYEKAMACPWPFLPMHESIKIGDVYLGVDKLAHFFSFGRKYFNTYQTALENGFSEQEAVEKTIKKGIKSEERFVGKLVDGIVSYGDLEANFQGFLMLKKLTSNETPCFVLEDGKWKATNNKIDLGDFVTPGFDESYNPSYYWANRSISAKIVNKRYCGKQDLVKERFDIYDEYEKSDSQRYIKEHMSEKRRRRMNAQSLDTLCNENNLNNP
tara:strand:+ start:1003 stop:1983 length:981 start_codon:yes stop_codon:yes gene_type:complete